MSPSVQQKNKQQKIIIIIIIVYYELNAGKVREMQVNKKHKYHQQMHHGQFIKGLDLRKECLHRSYISLTCGVSHLGVKIKGVMEATSVTSVQARLYLANKKK